MSDISHLPFRSPAISPDSDPRSVIARHGRSFHFASKLLDRETASRCARLYRFCRYVDDIADQARDAGRAQLRLRQIQQDLSAGRSGDPIVLDFLVLSDQCDINREPAIELVRGVRSDLGRVRIPDVAALHQYCFRVAGTVGLMMCDVLDVTNPRASAYAIDLGIAMQLTNIARDVGEDALANRRYIPASLLGEVEPKEIVNPGRDLEERLADAVRWLLEEADCYYRSGERGMGFLPDRARLGVRASALIYRHIGNVIRARHYTSWQGRAVVPGWRKALLSLRACAREINERGAELPVRHQTHLHRELVSSSGFPISSLRFGD